MKYFPYIVVLFVILFIAACDEQKEHTAPAILERDSVAVMTSYGVNTLISDSGIMRYRLISERWDVNQNLHPQRWIFPRGLFMEQFDENFHTEAYVQSDTAYYYNDQKLWHLIGNVRVRTMDGVRFSSEELWWDQNAHELYSNLFSHVITPERELQGAYFQSDEHMQHYNVTNTKGNFTREDAEGKKDGNAATDSTPQRQPMMPAGKHK